MKARLFSLLSVASLILCLAAAMLWARSHWRYDLLVIVSDTMPARVPPQSLHLQLESYNGNLAFTWFPCAQRPREWVWTIHPPRRELQVGRSTSGFSWRFGPTLNCPDWVGIPHWFLAAIFAILPLCWLRRIKEQRRRARSGLCYHCGYDLRAHKPGDRCPECGAPVLAVHVPKVGP
jgi:hypothetical protein